MSRTLDYSVICRYICIIGAIVGTLLISSAIMYPQLIFLSLLIFINSQIRVRLLKERLFLASLFIEVVLVIYLYSLSGGYIYIVLFSTLVDAVLSLKGEAYLVFIIIAAVLVYALYASKSLEWTLAILAFLIVVFLLLLQLRQELNIRADTEALYDQIRRNNYQLEAAKARLLDYSKQVEKVSQLEERNRISRELHDSIGHDLTGVLMQVDAAIQILPLDMEKGMRILSSAYENINSSIENVRRTVRKLSPAPLQNHMASLKELVEKFQKDTGVVVEIITTGTPYKLYPGIEITLYKNTREALTNAVRHGHASNIKIHLQYSSDSVQLHISDDGTGADSIKKGFGLSGMEERLELLGGTISYSGEKGFRVHMEIPIYGRGV